MENENDKKYKIELSETEIDILLASIRKKVDWGFSHIDVARDYIKLYDKLKKAVEENSINE